MSRKNISKDEEKRVLYLKKKSLKAQRKGEGGFQEKVKTKGQ